MRKPAAVVLLSGGMDSATVLAQALEQGWNVLFALGIDYGQRHSRELESAHKIAAYYRVKYRTVALPTIASFHLTNRALSVPAAKDDKQHLTIVPGRNAVLCSYAAALAISEDANEVFIGACADDYRSYPDCRPLFVDYLSTAFEVGYGVSVNAPLVRMSKTEIVALGVSLAVPYRLTYTCYQGAEEPCLQCDACVERSLAMTANGLDYFGDLLVAPSEREPVGILSKEDWLDE